MKVAIIGAGASGLAAIKCCLDEGLLPVCLEKQDDIGGIWRYVSTYKDGATVYKSTVINSSKEMMCYSDFPIPKEFPNYMHNTKVQDYFRLYAEKFDLMKYINFHSEVLSCIPADDFASKGQWKVVTRCLGSNETKTEIYGAVLVCVGHHAIPHYPLDAFPGIENFKGKYNHSHDYRDYGVYEDLRVVIIGIGNSGGDLAVELSRQCKQVYLSTRKGAWVFKRVAENGMPGDFVYFTRFGTDVGKLMPRLLFNAVSRKNVNSHIDHQKYSLEPKHEVFAQHPTVNDDLADRIITGSIIVKENIVRFTETVAVFEDGTEEEVDAVIFATGYSVAYPFLSPDIIKVAENDADLYKYVFPISLPRHTLAIVGCIQPLGAINPISEMQCRWATRVFKKEAVLPTNEEMEKEINAKRQAMKKRYVHSRRHTVQVDHIEYMDEIAEQVPCKPNLLRLLLTDPMLAKKVYFGPAVPSIYRLEGHGKWSLARETIMTADVRVLHPLESRKIHVERKSGLVKMICTALLALFAVWCLNLCQ